MGLTAAAMKPSKCLHHGRLTAAVGREEGGVSRSIRNQGQVNPEQG